MWNIQTNKQTKNKNIDTQNRVVVTRREAESREGKMGKGGQLYGERMETKLLVVSTLWCIQNVMLYTWNIYNVINQCYLNKAFNFKINK